MNRIAFQVLRALSGFSQSRPGLALAGHPNPCSAGS